MRKKLPSGLHILPGFAGKIRRKTKIIGVLTENVTATHQ
jgi:hypothetical protein